MSVAAATLSEAQQASIATSIVTGESPALGGSGTVIATGRDAGLVRSVGLFGLLTTIINCVIGAGIFKLPAEMAHLVGGYAPFAYVGCAIAMGAVSICFAEAGSRVPTSGGAYGPIGAALGPLVGFIAGVMIWLTSVLAAGGIFAAFADAAGALIPSLATPAIRLALLMGAAVAVTIMNLVSARTTSRLISAATILKLIPIVVFLVAGIFAIQQSNLVINAPWSTGAFGRASVIGLFAFTGMETALGASGEVRNPTRTVPRALLLAMALITVVYIGIQFVAQGLMGDALAGSAAPLADSIGLVSPGLRTLVLVGMLVSMFGYLAGNTFGTPRMLFAFARDGYLPKSLGKIHPKTHVPHVAIIVNSVLAAALALSGTFVKLAVLSTLAAALAYMLGCIAAVVLRRRKVATSGAPLVMKGMPAFAVLGVVSMVWLVAQAELDELIGSAICIAVCAAYFLVLQKVRRAKTA